MICLVILITYHKHVVCMFIIYLIKFKIYCVLKWYVLYSYCKFVIYKVTQGAKWKKKKQPDGRQRQVWGWQPGLMVCAVAGGLIDWLGFRRDAAGPRGVRETEPTAQVKASYCWGPMHRPQFRRVAPWPVERYGPGWKACMQCKFPFQ